MKLGRWMFAVALVICAGIILQPTALAKKKGGAKTPPPQQQENNDENTNNAPPATQPDDPIAKASAAVDAAEKKARELFESGADWKAVTDNYNRAHDAYHMAAANVTAALKTRPDYVAALAAKTKAEDDLDALRNTGTATSDQIAAGADNAMNARTAVTQLEMTATSADPTVVDAKAKLAAAVATLADEHKKEDLAVAADPDWQAAKKDLDDARGNLASAK